MATLHIIRTSQYANKFRDFILELDGREIGRIADGKRITIEIPDGKHQLVGRIDWTTSNTIAFDTADNSNPTFKIGGQKAFKSAFHAFFNTRHYLTLEIVS